MHACDRTRFQFASLLFVPPGWTNAGPDKRAIHLSFLSRYAGTDWLHADSAENLLKNVMSQDGTTVSVI
ncbi:hypothetical protein BZM27_41650 [Paraburkholderia steynii]|uniref:Uncharacterized protein n=1 Tax=Paraburkholderia steynii TaxID=1245441 RepID=A0A4V2NGB9_9BURK|nr:hypothetical protein BZM27_41650 [Paraburkholderia steynii]